MRHFPENIAINTGNCSEESFVGDIWAVEFQWQHGENFIEETQESFISNVDLDRDSESGMLRRHVNIWNVAKRG